jgi:hypothetical protein
MPASSPKVVVIASQEGVEQMVEDELQSRHSLGRDQPAVRIAQRQALVERLHVANEHVLRHVRTSAGNVRDPLKLLLAVGQHRADLIQQRDQERHGRLIVLTPDTRDGYREHGANGVVQRMWQGRQRVGHARGHRVIHALVVVTETGIEERQVLHLEVAGIAVGPPLPVVDHEKVAGERGLHVESRRYAQEQLGEPCRQRRGFGCRIGIKMRERAQACSGACPAKRSRWPGPSSREGRNISKGWSWKNVLGRGFREEGGDARQLFFQRREFPPERYTEPSRCDEPHSRVMNPSRPVAALASTAVS